MRLINPTRAEERIVALYRKEKGYAADIFNTAVDAAQTIILDMYDNEAIEAEPVRHGSWWHYEGTLTCTICGAEFDDGILEYCGDDVPHRCLDCGAIMDGEESEDGEIR